MSLPAAVKNVGVNVAVRQAESVYQLSRQASEKTKLGFSNNAIWPKTFNASVTSENQGDGSVAFRLSFRYQQNKGTKSKRKLLKRHATKEAAEAATTEQQRQ